MSVVKDVDVEAMRMSMFLNDHNDDDLFFFIAVNSE